MIQLDLNNPEFQVNLLALPQQEAWAVLVLKTLRMVQALMQSAALAGACQQRSAAE